MQHNNTSKVYSPYICLGIPPEAFRFVPASVLTRNPPSIWLNTCSSLDCCSWEKGFSSGNQHDLPHQDCWRPPECIKVQAAHGKMVGGCFCLFAEQATVNLRRRSCSWSSGWGLQPLIVPLPPSLITASSFILGSRPFLTISWKERSCSRWGNECFGYLMTQKQWEKCKQHWTDALIQVSILGRCDCGEEISSVILCSFLQMLS